jgi:hypothetical protein
MKTLLLLLGVTILLVGCLADSRSIWITNLTNEPTVVSFYSAATETDTVSLDDRNLREIPCDAELTAIINYDAQKPPYALVCGRKYVLRKADSSQETELVEVVR